jgi:hypothetical protein
MQASFTRMSFHSHLYTKPQIYRTKNHTNFDIQYLDSPKYALLSCVASSVKLPNLREESSETGNPTPKKSVREQDAATTQTNLNSLIQNAYVGNTVHNNTAWCITVHLTTT